MQLNEVPHVFASFYFHGFSSLYSTVMIYDGITVEDISAMIDISPVSM